MASTVKPVRRGAVEGVAARMWRFGSPQTADGLARSRNLTTGWKSCSNRSRTPIWRSCGAQCGGALRLSRSPGARTPRFASDWNMHFVPARVRKPGMNERKKRDASSGPAAPHRISISGANCGPHSPNSTAHRQLGSTLCNSSCSAASPSSTSWIETLRSRGRLCKNGTRCFSSPTRVSTRFSSVG